MPLVGRCRISARPSLSCKELHRECSMALPLKDCSEVLNAHVNGRMPHDLLTPAHPDRNSFRSELSLVALSDGRLTHGLTRLIEKPSAG